MKKHKPEKHFWNFSTAGIDAKTVKQKFFNVLQRKMQKKQPEKKQAVNDKIKKNVFDFTQKQRNVHNINKKISQT